MIPIFDTHLDLAWSAVFFDRDLTRPLDEVRRYEDGMTDEPFRGKGTVTLPELRRGAVAVCVATLLARGGPQQKKPRGYKRSDLDYVNRDIAHCAAHAQLAWYRLMEQRGCIRLIRTAGELRSHWQRYTSDPQAAPLGVILSMEGADPILDPEHSASVWWDAGLRAVGLAHYGRSHFAYGTATDGPLSNEGVALLRHFHRMGMILDVTHLCDQSMAQALDLFEGPVYASHHNCRALVGGDRQLTDEQIKRLVDRQGIIGVALDAWMLYPGWVRGQTRPEVVGLDAVADHIDHVCQIAGSAEHSAIGSDLDGGFGTEQTPRDLNTIADLQKLADILARRGYSDADVRAVFHGNALRFFTENLPKE